MCDFKGKLHETAVKFPQTHIWMDSCGEEELKYAIERGAVGATSNPIIVGAVVKAELSYWEKTIRRLCEAMTEANEDDIAWELIHEVGRQRSKSLLPIFHESNGKMGRLSIQTNAKNYRSKDKMLEQALQLNALAENMQIKMPACEAGIAAMEEATYHGASINATVSFTVAQAVAVAEAVERGLARRRAEGLPTDTMSPVCTIMIGRTDDWVKTAVQQDGTIVDPECLEWAGIAVFKEAYRIYRERGYTTRLLSAAYRNHHHWSQLIGGEVDMTIPYGWHKRLNSCNIEVISRMDDPVPQAYLEQLNTLPEFRKSFEEKAMTPAEFDQYGGFRATLTTFIQGYYELLTLIRGYMI